MKHYTQYMFKAQQWKAKQNNIQENIKKIMLIFQ